jgi:hypothetical protein
MHGNAVTLEGSEDSGVRDATRETSTERQSDARRDCLPSLSRPRQIVYRRIRSASSCHYITRPEGRCQTWSTWSRTAFDVSTDAARIIAGHLLRWHKTEGRQAGGRPRLTTENVPAARSVHGLVLSRAATRARGHVVQPDSDWTTAGVSPALAIRHGGIVDVWFLEGRVCRGGQHGREISLQLDEGVPTRTTTACGRVGAATG